ncbi:hypothetical protein [Streptomyces chartreusis]
MPAFVPSGLAPTGAADLLDTLAGLRLGHREIYLMTAGQALLDDIGEAVGRLASGQRACISDIVQVPVLIGTDSADERSRSL